MGSMCCCFKHKNADLVMYKSDFFGIARESDDDTDERVDCQDYYQSYRVGLNVRRTIIHNHGGT